MLNTSAETYAHGRFKNAFSFYKRTMAVCPWINTQRYINTTLKEREREREELNIKPICAWWIICINNKPTALCSVVGKNPVGKGMKNILSPNVKLRGGRAPSAAASSQYYSSTTKYRLSRAVGNTTRISDFNCCENKRSNTDVCVDGYREREREPKFSLWTKRRRQCLRYERENRRFFFLMVLFPSPPII